MRGDWEGPWGFKMSLNYGGGGRGRSCGKERGGDTQYPMLEERGRRALLVVFRQRF